jgi:hypothetical protein
MAHVLQVLLQLLAAAEQQSSRAAAAAACPLLDCLPAVCGTVVAHTLLMHMLASAELLHTAYAM